MHFGFLRKAPNPSFSSCTINVCLVSACMWRWTWAARPLGTTGAVKWKEMERTGSTSRSRAQTEITKGQNHGSVVSVPQFVTQPLKPPIHQESHSWAFLCGHNLICYLKTDSGRHIQDTSGTKLWRTLSLVFIMEQHYSFKH